MKEKLIGLFFCTNEQVKEEYIIGNIDKKYPLISVEIYTNKKYGAIAKMGDTQ